MLSVWKLQKVLCGERSIIPVLLPYQDLHGIILMNKDVKVKIKLIITKISWRSLIRIV
jgi:hypothetical protein